MSVVSVSKAVYQQIVLLAQHLQPASEESITREIEMFFKLRQRKTKKPKETKAQTEEEPKPIQVKTAITFGEIEEDSKQKSKLQSEWLDYYASILADGRTVYDLTEAELKQDIDEAKNRSSSSEESIDTESEAEEESTVPVNITDCNKLVITHGNKLYKKLFVKAEGRANIWTFTKTSHGDTGLWDDDDKYIGAEMELIEDKEGRHLIANNKHAEKWMGKAPTKHGKFSLYGKGSKSKQDKPTKGQGKAAWSKVTAKNAKIAWRFYQSIEQV